MPKLPKIVNLQTAQAIEPLAPKILPKLLAQEEDVVLTTFCILQIKISQVQLLTPRTLRNKTS